MTSSSRGAALSGDHSGGVSVGRFLAIATDQLSLELEEHIVFSLIDTPGEIHAMVEIDGTQATLQRRTSFHLSGPRKPDCIYYRDRGLHICRFITAAIRLIPDEKNQGRAKCLKELHYVYLNGIQFGGCTYHFLGGKPRKSLSESANSTTCWFFAEKHPYGEYISVGDLRNRLGDFGDQRPLKINSRISLGFSRANLWFELKRDDILVVDDIRSGKNVLTDGCGLIAVRLPHYYE